MSFVVSYSRCFSCVLQVNVLYRAISVYRVFYLCDNTKNCLVVNFVVKRSDFRRL